MEKLLVPAAMQRIAEQGADALGGPVTRVQDMQGMGAAERVKAHRLDGDLFPFGPSPEHVDVLRFETTPLMALSVPGPVGERPWPTYEHGFLANVVPVWLLDMTRVPTGAAVVRVSADGSERVLSTYGGAAWGWQRATGYFPPLHLIGARAKWRGLDLPCSYDETHQSVELVWVGDQGVPDGFTPARPRVHARRVSVVECDSVFEIVLTAQWRGAPVRILQSAGDEALLMLLEPDMESINRLGATALEPSLFQAVAPRTELVDVAGQERLPAS